MRVACTLVAVLLGVACSDDDDMPMSDSGVDSGGGDTGPSEDAGPGEDTGPDDDGGTEDSGGGDGGTELCVAPGVPSPMCTRPDTYYTPGAAEDMWPACVSDAGEYVRIEDTISTIARVMAYEEIAALLFDPTTDPSADDFLMARTIYQEDEGLDSRLVRRFDPRFDVPPGTDCTMPDMITMYPEYCVGPGILQPIVLDGLAAGMSGEMPTRIHAARIHAALIWFLYSSTSKESFTCTTTARDCDSAYAYYAGGEAAGGGIGLAEEVDAVDPVAHDAMWDAILAMRCWRDLDPEPTATMDAVRERARTQMDNAVSKGVASILRNALASACGAEGDELSYYWEFARTLAPALDRIARAREATLADVIETEMASATAADADIPAVIDALDAIFECP